MIPDHVRGVQFGLTAPCLHLVPILLPGRRESSLQIGLNTTADGDSGVTSDETEQ